jgi:hypothetical protein
VLYTNGITLSALIKICKEGREGERQSYRKRKGNENVKYNLGNRGK